MRQGTKLGNTDGPAFSLRNRLVLGSALATSAFLGGYRGYVRRAYAQCAGAGGTYTCSGALATTQFLTGTPLTVTTTPGFSIDTSPGTSGNNAFDLHATGGLTFTDNYSSTISGAYNGTYGYGSGIEAINVGSGALSITTSGPVKGSMGPNAFGIFAQNSGTDMTIVTADVTSYSRTGIKAYNYGGSLSIDTTRGTVAAGYNGINAANLDSYVGGYGLSCTTTSRTTGLRIAAANVTGGENGILARNCGTGELSITVNGTAQGASLDGISARNFYGTYLKIVATNASGGLHGISARNDGTGALSIKTYGTVTGTNLEGIYARNAGTDLTINALGAVTGGESGIFARNFGSGELSITATGAVKGTKFNGIYARNSVNGTDLKIVAANASGGERGIVARNDSSGALSITTTGAVTGAKYDGIVARNYGSGPTSFTNSGAIEGSTGIFAKTAGPVTVTNTGSITGTNGIAIDLTASTGPKTVNQQAGTIDGNILMSPTSGVLNITGGTILGNFISALTTTNHSGGVIAPGHSIGTLTIAGNYVGDGGTLEIEAELGGDASPADRLVVTGGTSGSSNVRVINVGGAGAQTVNGIKVIDVGGNSAGTFTLLGNFQYLGQPAVVAGAYAYVLDQNGINTPTDGDWYLRSALFAPSMDIYEAYPGVLQSFNQSSTLQQRLGNRSWTIEAQGADSLSEEVQVAQGLGAWARIEGAHGDFDPRTSTTGTTYDASFWKLETGFDMPLYEQENGRLIGGIAVHYGKISSDVASDDSDGSIDSTGYGFTGTLTWYDNAGFYVDGQARVTWFDSDIYSDTLSTSLASGNDGLGYTFSVETGQRIAIAPRWSLTPQAQLVYAAVDFDDFADPFGATVSLDDGDSLIGRLGLSADYEEEWQDAAQQTSRAHLYGIANLYYDFLSGSTVDVSGLDFISENQTLWGGLGVGGTLSWANGKYSLFGEGQARTSLDGFGDSYVISGNIGLSLNW